MKISCRIAIHQLFTTDPRPRSPREVIEELDRIYPGAWSAGTVRAHLTGLCTNHGSAPHYPHLQQFAFLTQTPNGQFAPTQTGAGLPTMQPSHEVTRRGPNRPSKVRVRRSQRMSERSADLANDFEAYLAAFESRSVFGGPSVHFHVRAIERRATHENVRSALADDQLVELTYAMLTSWGMHRMGPKGAKLVDYDDFLTGLRRQENALRALDHQAIEALDDAEAMADALWDVIADARLSATGTQIVAGTKALHHFLPSLVPPIDREYTIRFFHENKIMSIGDERAFKEIYPALAEIAASPNVTPHLRPNGRSRMNTSTTKILDNAIIGYVWTHLKDSGQVSME